MYPDVMAYNVMVRKIRNSRDYDNATNVYLNALQLSAAKVILHTCCKAYQSITISNCHYKDFYIISKYLTFCCAPSPYVGGGPPSKSPAAKELAAGLNDDNS
ncbi:unnamed protein product [Ceratitis capitata]|uniref:(Mediterranean fruit fly) hypothetical protein n=1 Tax=Ceratitis capitata TaxID=7213 RepID=W8BL56_CERCA|nr:unnamed protein product [Ceratitis capitata]